MLDGSQKELLRLAVDLTRAIIQEPDPSNARDYVTTSKILTDVHETLVELSKKKV